MSAIDQFRRDARHLIAAHGAGTTVTVTDEQAVDDPTTGGQIPDPRSFTAACTLPTPYSQGMVDGERILAGDCNVFLERGDPAITFRPELGMKAVVAGPQFAARQFGVQRSDELGGSLELHLRGGAEHATL